MIHLILEGLKSFKQENFGFVVFLASNYAIQGL